MARAPNWWSACGQHDPETLTTESLTLEEIFVVTLKQ